MAADLQKVILNKLLVNSNDDMYAKLLPQYFTGANKLVFNLISLFYKENLNLPSREEFLLVRKSDEIQEYLESEIFTEENSEIDVDDKFLLSQLQDFFVREETLTFLTQLLDNLEQYEKVEIIDSFQDHILNVNNSLPYDEELFDAAELDLYPKEDDIKLFPSGLSNDYDEVNGGFGTQELILLGGRRGSGKSIITLNMALTRFLAGNTIAFFSIEMRYKEVYDRLLSIISGVPFLDIFRNKLTPQQKLTLARAKINKFYQPTDLIYSLFEELEKTRDFLGFEKKLKSHKPKLKDNRFFIIDDPSLTVSKVDNYCNKFTNTYPNFNLAAVDYLNIIKTNRLKNWETQIESAEGLKLISRRRDLTMLSPYQIDATGEARFAKGILDSADRGFNFFPPPEDGERSLVGDLTIHTTKIRNGRSMSFDVTMDWECVRIVTNSAKIINERPHSSVRYGSSQENTMDVG